MSEAPKDSVPRLKKRSDGEGSIYQRHKAGCPDKGATKPKCKCPWQGAYTIPYSSPRDVKKVSGSTRAAASANLQDLIRQIKGDELPATGESMTVERWVTYWFNNVAARKVKPLTLAGYDTKVNQYIIPLLGHHRLDRLTPEHIEDAWDSLREHGNPTKADPKPLSANTIHQTHRILARALKVAIQRKRLRTNPAGSDSMDAPQRIDQPITPPTEAEVDAILDTARGQWNAARWNVALAIGLRQGEALGLRWSDVDLDAGVINVRQTLMRLKGKGIVFGTPKSAKSTRAIVLPASLADRLRAHRVEQTAKRLEFGSHWTDSGLVFTMQDGRPIDPSVDAGRWRKLLQDAGVRHYRLHDARHAAATMMVSDGVDIRSAMAILGHSQLSVTMRYQAVVDQAKQAAATQIDRGGRWA